MCQIIAQILDISKNQGRLMLGGSAHEHKIEAKQTRKIYQPKNRI